MEDHVNEIREYRNALLDLLGIKWYELPDQTLSAIEDVLTSAYDEGYENGFSDGCDSL